MSTPAFTEQSLGKRGSKVINSNSGTVSGNFAIIVAGPAGVKFESDGIVCSNKDNVIALTDIDIPAGYTSYGNFTSLDVKTGSIEAYNA
jgi:hypothetical protein